MRLSRLTQLLAALAVSLPLAGCDAPVQRVAQTPSGKPEGLFLNSSAPRIAARLAQRCVAKGNQLRSMSNNRVVCAREMTGGSAVMAQMLIGNSYSTTPEGVVTYSVFQNGRNVRVYVDAWIESQMAFGQMRRMNMTDNNHVFNDAMKMLWEMGAVRPKTA